MKNTVKYLGILIALAVVFTACEKNEISINPHENQDNLEMRSPNNCTNIQSGELLTTDGNVIETGFDDWGYNYQGHMFNGGYCDAYRNAAWCQLYADVELLMKWNEAWLSNKDCDDDGLLDRHPGHETYIGSGAWITNHQAGTYTDGEGNECSWNYFVKIVAAPADAYIENDVWYNANDTEIGPVIWGQFAIIQQVENDPCTGANGLQYNSPDHSGLGAW